jgi:MFS family permease
MSSWVLTIFLIGYALANVVGGVATRKLEPKTVVMASFVAGCMVGLLYRASGSYMLGFTVLGGIVIFGGIALLASGWIVMHRKPGSSVSLQY